MVEANVYIDAQTAVNGVAQYKNAAEDFATMWSTASGNISAKAGAAPWGGDEAGTSFAGNFKGTELLTNENSMAIKKKITDMAGQIEKAFAESYAADHEAAAKVNAVDFGNTKL